MVGFRYDWLININSMQKEMERLLSYLGSSKPPPIRFSPGMWEPAMDVYETGEEVTVQVELAGVRQGEFELVVDSNTLVIRGERKDTLTSRRRTYYQMEIHKGFFERSILLPTPVDPSRAKASYEDGLLVVNLPKAAVEQTFRVEIKATFE